MDSIQMQELLPVETVELVLLVLILVQLEQLLVEQDTLLMLQETTYVSLAHQALDAQQLLQLHVEQEHTRSDNLLLVLLVLLVNIALQLQWLELTVQQVLFQLQVQQLAQHVLLENLAHLQQIQTVLQEHIV